VNESLKKEGEKGEEGKERGRGGNEKEGSP